MANVSMTSGDDEQPLLGLIQKGSTGKAASIRIDDPNPDIEFVETRPSRSPTPRPASSRSPSRLTDFQINGRRAAGSPVKGFDVIVVFQRPAAGGNIGFGFRRNIDYGDFGGGRGAIVIVECGCWRRHTNVAGAPDPLRRGWRAQVSRIERHRDRDRSGIAIRPLKDPAMTNPPFIWPLGHASTPDEMNTSYGPTHRRGHVGFP